MRVVLAGGCGRTDGVNGRPVRHQAKVVLENSSGVKQRHRYSHDALQTVLWTHDCMLTSHNARTNSIHSSWGKTVTLLLSSDFRF